MSSPQPSDRELQRRGCIIASHHRQGGCYMCCNACNLDKHQCPGCGTPLRHDGLEADGKPHPDCIDF